VRASAIDVSTAGLMGINVNRVSLIVFVIFRYYSSYCRNVFRKLKYTVYPGMGAMSTKAFIASVIGGLGSLPGAVLGRSFYSVFLRRLSPDIFPQLIEIFSHSER